MNTSSSSSSTDGLMSTSFSHLSDSFGASNAFPCSGTSSGASCRSSGTSLSISFSSSKSFTCLSEFINRTATFPCPRSSSSSSTCTASTFTINLLILWLLKISFIRSSSLVAFPCSARSLLFSSLNLRISVLSAAFSDRSEQDPAEEAELLLLVSSSSSSSASRRCACNLSSRSNSNPSSPILCSRRTPSSCAKKFSIVKNVRTCTFRSLRY